MVRVRFAPSPTGYLHVGGARTALFNYLFARHHNGSFILRIEDTDLARSERIFEENLMKTLRWLGLHWDEGPDIGGKYGPYRQSERLHIYAEYAEKLVKFDKAYRVYAYPEEIEKIREDLLSKGLPPHYTREMFEPFATRERIREYEEKGLKPAIYFAMPREKIVHHDLVKGEVVFSEGSVGDFAILRSNGVPTYNFACVVDDMLMEITHVIRGDDHLPNTLKQLAIYKAFGVNPPLMGHVSMILGPDGKKLSKRHGATSIEEFMERGYLPEAVVNYLALLGWSSPDGKEIMSMEEMISKFSLERVSKNPAIFDPAKLTWMNSQYIKATDSKRLVELLKPFLKKWNIEVEDKNWLERVVEVEKERMHTLEDFLTNADYFFKAPKVEVQIPEDIKKALEKCAQELSNNAKASREELVEIFRKVVKESNVKPKDFYQTLRLVLTGKQGGPELLDIVLLLGIEEVVRRIEASLGV
ncbi:glutamate--tRNA ligase [Pseudothermotoga thermarum]|uniref:Glutamate--tRNA ligase n=1 Tax=Pseudothermotoga thermarum DSM 5069 TaxID=688269 RepID=F7YXQ0_9THEM|nr:glutamate--tRNA ligase [Pseudothermotoga thermarum]AEH50694.1 glutamyl-tRNA synthetase [Pseudothermotoga thermarum DSM 5069]